MKNSKKVFSDLMDIFEEMKMEPTNVNVSSAKDWIRSHNESFTCWINGAFKNPSGSLQYHPVQWNSVGPPEIRILEGAQCAEAAVISSLSAQLKWKNESPRSRCDILYRISNALKSKAEIFSQLQLHKIRSHDFKLFVDYFDFYSGIFMTRFDGWEPVGVVLIVFTNKSPIWVLSMNIAAALSAGCSVILKPSLSDPFPAYLLADICSQVGLPNGLLNIVPGSNATVEALLAQDINKVVFINDYLNVDSFYKTIPQNYLSFLSMNHTASVVLEPCDMQAAVDKIFSETWIHGDSWGIDVIVVQESVIEVFLRMLKCKLEIYSSECEGSSVFNDQIIQARKSKIISEAKRMGATVLECSNVECSFAPSIIIGYQSECNDPEVPIITVLASRTANEAANIINNVPYCFATSIWTDNWPEALELAAELNTNTVWINSHGVAGVAVPMEPDRKSGLGCFGGTAGASDFMILKGTCIKADESHICEENDTSHQRLLGSIVHTSCNQYKKWKVSCNRKDNLKNIYYSMISSHELKEHSGLLDYWAHAVDPVSITRNEQDFHILITGVPRGIISIILTDKENIVAIFISLVTPAIAFGNVVIVVVPEECFYELKKTIECFCKHIPDGVVTVVKGISYAYGLSSHANTNIFWLHGKPASILVKKMKCRSGPHINSFWISPNNVPQCATSFRMMCTRNKAIWLPKSHHK